MTRAKRILFAADPHCGHRVGLTPPPWQYRPVVHDRHQMKYLRIEREGWKWFTGKVDAMRPFDIAVWNGDLIEGPGHRSGGTELITTDRNKQIDMAVAVVRRVNAKHNIFIRGTPYHCGEQEDMEDIIAARFGTEAHDHEWLDINGIVFDVKHFIAGSQVPHGRLTSLGREELWNALWAEADYQPRADYIVRAHVHYSVGGFRTAGAKQIHFLTLPALQAMGTKFGARRCSGLVDFGFDVFDIDRKGSVTWRRERALLLSQRTTVQKL